ncbi:MAG: hypothetical protein PHE53_09270 [Thermoguttaceae bacterium]|nr:hypothetical protein [Thermoguttaceae bacterium]
MSIRSCVWVMMVFCTSMIASISVVATASEPVFQVDFSDQMEPLRAVNGTNLWAPFSLESFQNSNDAVKQARFSLVRLHDCPWDNDGQRLVDVHQIFGNLSADPQNPENYYFKPTDDYIDRILHDGGSKVLYRLGSSIEHTTEHYFTGPPADPERYAEICAGIVRHYNHGWANGFYWNIQYWEIWNEPDLCPQMWSNTDFQTYCDFYVTVAKRLHAEFPEIRIGGPGLTGANLEKLGMLADACRQAGVPFDFCSWHGYASVPEQLLDTPAQVRQLLDTKGFTKTELHLNEWHYFPAPWSEVHGLAGGAERRNFWRNAPEGINGYDAAAFVGYVLSRWQDTPLDMGNYYATGLTTWGLIGPDAELRKPYYTHIAFADLLEKYPMRVRTSDTQYISLLGGVRGDNGRAILVSCWKQNQEHLEIAVRGVAPSGEVRIKRLDRDHNLTEETLTYTDGLLRIDNSPGSFVLLIEWP